MEVYVQVDIDKNGRITHLLVTSDEPADGLTGGREVYRANVDGVSELVGVSVARGRVNGIIH